MKVKIDPDLCTGCEDCTEACPSLFKMGPDWIAVPVQEQVPPELEAEAVKTADLCQFEAIRIEND
jgi:ferredoxin